MECKQNAEEHAAFLRHEVTLALDIFRHLLIAYKTATVQKETALSRVHPNESPWQCFSADLLVALPLESEDRRRVERLAKRTLREFTSILVTSAQKTEADAKAEADKFRAAAHQRFVAKAQEYFEVKEIADDALKTASADFERQAAGLCLQSLADLTGIWAARPVQVAPRSPLFQTIVR